MPTLAHPAIRDRCVVLPLQPTPGQTFDGVGLALHFLLGNVVVLHSRLKELWFGWRIKDIFENATQLSAYCRGQGPSFDLNAPGRQDLARLWMYGQYDHQKAKVSVYDSQRTHAWRYEELPFSCARSLVEFRQSFIALFDQTGFKFPRAQEQAALWEENISLSGLNAVGRALEAYYRFSAFDQKGLLDPTPFEQAVALAPNAFMAHDLMGWAHYRNQNYPKAVSAFQQALSINPHGVGVMAGLMWCAVHTHDLDETRRWASRKAEICRQDAAQATKKALQLFQNHL